METAQAGGRRSRRRAPRWARLAVPAWLVAITLLGAHSGLRMLADVQHHDDAVAATSRLIWLAAAQTAGIVLLLAYEGSRRRALAVDAASETAAAHYHKLVNGSSELIAVADEEGRITYASPASSRVLGHAPADLVGTDFFDLIHPDDLAAATATTQRLLEGADMQSVVLRFRHRAGSWRHLESLASNLVDDPTVAGIVWNSRDVTDRQALDARLVRQAYHDSLTGLPNRLALMEHLDQALAVAGPQSGALVLVALDHMDQVNDSRGHLIGDQVIVRCVQRLVRAAHPDDLVARIADHTFAIWSTAVTEPRQALAFADRLGAIVDDPFGAGRSALPMRLVASIAQPDGRGEEAEVLLHRADLALVRARRDGVPRIYDRSMHDALEREHAMEDLVAQVVGGWGVTLGYQPIVRLDDDRIVGAEALLRLVDQDGFPAPALDVALAAERCGRMGELTELVLTTACADAARWRRIAPERSISVAVNVSAAQLDDPTLPDRVARALATTGLEPSALSLELTESALMQDPVRSARLLTSLKLLGVKLSAAGFGRGHSSLAYLKTFPLDLLKIDRTFVAGLPGNLEDFAITRAIVVMADALGIDVVAEGVESADQRDTLMELGIGRGQGFLWAAALPALEFESSLLVEADDAPQAPSATVRPTQIPGLAHTASAEERMDATLRVLAHELRGPLTVVTGYASLLEGAADPDDASAAAAISRAAARLGRILTDVLEASSGGPSASAVDPEPVAVRDLVATIVGDLAPTTANELVLGPLPEPGVVVVVDAVQIGQVIANLVSNAAKFSPPDAVIDVTVSCDDGSVDVAVSDHGPGVAADDLGHIFRKYGQGDHARGGSGLGLFVGRRIARNHGGDLLYRRRLPGPGSTFTLHLPQLVGEPVTVDREPVTPLAPEPHRLGSRPG